MRLALALAVGLLWTAAAAAQTAPDRYGPPRPASTPATVAALYDGPVLRWASKRAPVVVASTPAEPPRPPQAWTGS